MQSLIKNWRILTRRKVVAKPKDYSCPICSKQFFTIKDLSYHLAMKKDFLHKEWRLKNSLPEDYEKLKEVAITADKVRNFLVK